MYVHRQLVPARVGIGKANHYELSRNTYVRYTPGARVQTASTRTCTRTAPPARLGAGAASTVLTRASPIRDPGQPSLTDRYPLRRRFYHSSGVSSRLDLSIFCPSPQTTTPSCPVPSPAKQRTFYITTTLPSRKVSSSLRLLLELN
jgi:hypothetical protein